MTPEDTLYKIGETAKLLREALKQEDQIIATIHEKLTALEELYDKWEYNYHEALKATEEEVL